MWDGYAEVSEVEIINVERVEAYAAAAGLSWFKALYRTTALHELVGDGPYVDPVTDVAPWYDSAVPHSREFLGVYPLEIAGGDDDTSSSVVTEAVGEGGTLSLTRRASKSGVFNVLLIATSSLGADYGRQWLGKALRGPCGSAGDCDGLSLAYLAGNPAEGDSGALAACSDRLAPRPEDPTDLAELLARSWRKVALTAPLTISAKRKLSDGGAIWMASFTLTATNPNSFGAEVPFLTGWLDPGVVSPWPEGTPPAGASIDGPDTVDEVTCLPVVFTPIVDPLCSGIVPPPTPPGITWGCYTAPAAWDRYTAVIPNSLVPGWTEAATVISVTPAVDEEVRNVRVRFYPDPEETGVITSECDWVGDMVVSYVPEGHVLTIDEADHVVYIDSPDGVRRRADSLVFGSDGGFFTWPRLTCGQQYVMTLDIDPAGETPSVDVSLIKRFG